MIKKMLVFMIFCIMAISPAVVQADVANAVVYLDNQPLVLDPSPVINQQSKKLIIPVRKLFETLGVEVSFDQAKNYVVLKKDDIKLELPVGSNECLINGSKRDLELPTKIINGKAMAQVDLAGYFGYYGAKSDNDSNYYLTKDIALAYINFEKHFKGYTGTFKLYDLTADKYLVYNQADTKMQYVPASTYKILNSLIALQTGVIRDENQIIKWDGTQYPVESWNQDHNMKSAIQNSVIWFYQEAARRIGKERMQSYVTKVGYGNRQIGDVIDRFWLDGPLKISVDEQVDFITRLYQEELPFDKDVIREVKSILVNEQSSSSVLAGKTGSVTVQDKPVIGWYVGYIVAKNKPYIFATKIMPLAKDDSMPVSGAKAKEITKNILAELKIYQ